MVFGLWSWYILLADLQPLKVYKCEGKRGGQLSLSALPQSVYCLKLHYLLLQGFLSTVCHFGKSQIMWSDA